MDNKMENKMGNKMENSLRPGTGANLEIADM